MKWKNRTGSHLFFIEFIIVLFFFLIVSTVCLRLFARAHGITQRADALSHAQAAASSVTAVIEDVLTMPDDTADNTDRAKELLAAAVKYLPGAALGNLPYDTAEQEGLFLFYDKSFEPCAADSAAFLLTAAVRPESLENTLELSVYDDSHNPIYELSVTLHRPMTRKEALQ